MIKYKIQFQKEGFNYQNYVPLYFSHLEKKEQNFFVLNNARELGSEQIKVLIPFCVDNIFEGYSVDVYSFSNPLLRNNDVIALHTNEINKHSGRIGYFFSIKALADEENSIFDSHTLSYAYYALGLLLKGQANIDNVERVNRKEDSNIYKITDFFNEDIVLLVLCNEYINEIQDFNIDDYIYGLYKFGFIYNSNSVKNRNGILKIQEDQYKTMTENGRKIKIELKNKDFRNDYFISIYSKELVWKEKNWLTKFILSYQIIEILIDKIFIHSVYSIIEKNIPDKSTKFRDKINTVTTESERIKRLFTDYTRIDESLKNLCSSKFVTILSSLSIEIDEDKRQKLHSIIYHIRNTIVHAVRVVYNENKSVDECKMEELNDYFEYLIFEILSTFYCCPLPPVSNQI